MRRPCAALDRRRQLPLQHLEHALDAAVHAGWDTDTVAAVAGQLLGARWGASAVPAKWMRRVCGRGLSEDGSYDASMRAADLVRLARGLYGRPAQTVQFRPTSGRGAHASTTLGLTLPVQALPHPADERRATSAAWPARSTAATPPCRRAGWGRAEPRPCGDGEDDRVELLLIDDYTGRKNHNLHFMIDDGARAVCQLRHEGRHVLIHCVNAESRSPSLAVRYGVLRGRQVDEARGGK